MTEFTQDEIKRIAEALIEYDRCGNADGFDIDDYRIVRTHETTDDFKAGAANFSDISRATESGDGWSMDIIHGHQYSKGEPRQDLWIIDLGDVRAVVG